MDETKEVVESLPTVFEVVKKVAPSAKEINNINISYGTSRQIMNHADIPVLGYWVCEGIAGVMIYKTARKLWAYYVHADPMTTYGQKAAYEINEDQAVEFIESRGGVFVPGFDLAEAVRKQRGDMVAEVRLREHHAYAGGDYYDRNWVVYRLYKGDKGYSVYQTGEYRGTWRKLINSEISDFISGMLVRILVRSG